MNAEPRPIDGAVARFVGEVIIEFERLVGDTGELASTLRSMGMDDAAVNAVSGFIASRPGDVQGLTTAANDIVQQLGAGTFDGAQLLLNVVDVWRSVDALVGAAPVVAPTAGLDPVNVIDHLLNRLIDTQLRVTAPTAWAAGHAFGFFGTGQSPFTALGDLVENPLRFALARYLEQRREVTIDVAGLITGPRTTGLAHASLGEGIAVSPSVAAVVPTGHRIVQRIVLGLAADTFGDPLPITLDVIATAANGFAGLALTVGALTSETVAISDHLGVTIQPINAAMSVVLTGRGSVTPVVAGPPAVTVASTATDAVMLGSRQGLHVELAEPQLSARVNADGWGAGFGFGRFEVVVPADVAGDIVAIFLPASGIRLRGKLLASFDDQGFHADGGVGLTARWPDVIRLPGVTVADLTTAAIVGSGGFELRATGSLTAALGPLAVTIAGLGSTLALRPAQPGRANLALAHLEAPQLAMPTGFGLRLEAGLIRGGGFLRRDPVRDEYAGALELSLNLGPIELAVKAFGVFGSVGGSVSFIVVLSMEFTPAIELFLGLTLNGVGGVFGFNRTIDQGAIGQLVRIGRADELLFPRDVVGRAPAIIDSVNRVFPARRNQVVVGPLLKLGWGRPNSFVTLTVGILVTFPDPTLLVIIGRLRVALPDESAPIIDLRADFVGAIEFTTGNVSFDASLTNSRIGTFTLGGDLALRAGPQGFVFSAGGFHPRFEAPASVGALRRLSIDVSPPALVEIWAEAYVAITASTFQFGARAFLKAELGPIDVSGSLGFDVLIRTEPRFSFIAEISGEFSLRAGGHSIASAKLDVLLGGPGRWHARAHASISILFFSISGTVDLHWGDDAPASVSPPVDPADIVRRALSNDIAWTPVLAGVDGAAVRVREGADGLHPLGSLRLVQTAAPLNVALQRVGGSRVSSGSPVTIDVTVTGGRSDVARDSFASAQYFDLTDDERLSKPAFVRFDAGVVVQGAAWSAGTAREGEVVYEESLGEPDQSRWFTLASASMGSWMSKSAVVRAAGDRAGAASGGLGGATGAGGAVATMPGTAGSMASLAATEGVRVGETSYVVLDAATGQSLGDAADFGASAGRVTRRGVERLVVASFEVAS